MSNKDNLKYEIQIKKAIKNKDVDWLKTECEKIYYFGLGFIQIKFKNKRFRVNIYTTDLPPIVGDEDIHDHRYSFGSEILAGEFFQHIFQKIEGDKYILEEESCNANDPSNFLGYCDFVKLTTSIYTEGSFYEIDHNTFHRVSAGEAITLLTRPLDYAKPKARVARLKNAPKVCPFSKVLPDEELWEIVTKNL